MLKESCSRQKNSVVAMILSCAIAVCLIAAPNIIEILAKIDLKHIWVYDLFIVAVLAVTLFIFVKRGWYRYDYTVDDDGIKVLRYVGKKGVVMCNIAFTRIIYCYRGRSEYKKAIELGNPEIVVKCYNYFEKLRATAIVYLDENNRQTLCAVFNPSDELFAIISKKVLDK